MSRLSPARLQSAWSAEEVVHFVASPARQTPLPPPSCRNKTPESQLRSLGLIRVAAVDCIMVKLTRVSLTELFEIRWQFG